MGSWQAAALHGLARRGLVFDRVMGFASGALNGAAYALGALEDAADDWRDAGAGQAALLRRISGRGEDWLKARLRCPLTVVGVDRASRKPVYAHYTPHGTGGWDAPLSRHLAASGAIPALFPSTPVSMEALSECRDIVILETLPSPVFGRRQRWPLGGLGRAGRRKAREVVDDAIESLRRHPEPPRVFRLRPQQPLSGGCLDFSAEALARGFERGLEDAALFAARSAAFLVAPRQ